jgi:hypothetical protein
LESLVVMLRSAGFDPYIPNENLKRQLRDMGCDTVLDPEGLVKGWGYDQSMPLPMATPEDMNECAVYIDVKGHRNGPKIWGKWPRLKDRTLWYRINGGEPERVIKSDGFDCGDEVNPPCPILTPNQCYTPDGPWADKCYTFWPPFYRWKDYYQKHGRHGFSETYADPICLIHNLAGWGYGRLTDGMRALGIKFYGGGSPDGLIQHCQVPEKLSKALAMVHLKSSDAPGYALYEAAAAGCPIILTRRLVWRCKMEKLFEDGYTCLMFDRIGHQGLTDEDVTECLHEVREALEFLRNPGENRRIGMAAHDRLQALMWSSEVETDVSTFKRFMERFQ